MSTGLKHVVVGVDASDGSIALLDWAVRYAAVTGADLTIVSACPMDGRPDGTSAPDRGEGQAELIRRLDGLLNQTCTGVPHRLIVDRVAPAALLVRESENADLLVIGRRRTSGGARVSRTTHDVLLGASCPVVVVPTF